MLTGWVEVYVLGGPGERCPRQLSAVKGRTLLLRVHHAELDSLFFLSQSRVG